MRIKTILALVLVVVLVLMTHLLDNRSFKIVQQSLTNIYEDRLVAYDLTYKMNEAIIQHKLYLLEGHREDFISSERSFQDDFHSALKKYKETKLTVKEDEYLNKLEDQFNELVALDAKVARRVGGQEERVNSNVVKVTDKIIKTLDVLAEIQLDEGRRQVIYSNRAVESGTTMSRIELICILIGGLAIQFLLFFEPKKRKR